MLIYDDFLTYKSGVYQKTDSAVALGGHAVELMGWGVDGVNYWLVKNSWNELWGDNGFFRIRRGQCNIEDTVSGGIAVAPSVVV